MTLAAPEPAKGKGFAEWVSRLASAFRGRGWFYFLIAMGAALVIALGALGPASLFIENWARRDVEMQTNLAFGAISDEITTAALAKNGADLTPVLDRIAGGNADIALAYCSGDGGAPIRHL